MGRPKGSKNGVRRGRPPGSGKKQVEAKRAAPVQRRKRRAHTDESAVGMDEIVARQEAYNAPAPANVLDTCLAQVAVEMLKLSSRQNDTDKMVQTLAQQFYKEITAFNQVTAALNAKLAALQEVGPNYGAADTAEAAGEALTQYTNAKKNGGSTTKKEKPAVVKKAKTPEPESEFEDNDNDDDGEEDDGDEDGDDEEIDDSHTDYKV